jgi:hypothetical protein
VQNTPYFKSIFAQFVRTKTAAEVSRRISAGNGKVPDYLKTLGKKSVAARNNADGCGFSGQSKRTSAIMI